MKLTRRETLLGGLALAMAPQVTFADTSVLQGPAFGGSWRLVSRNANAPAVMSLVTDRIAAIDAAMSPYRDTSILSRFNRAGVGEVVHIPASMARVTRAALDVSRDTGGAFDPTTGPLVARFGYGPITGRVGRIEDVDLRDGSLRKTAPGLTLDLCGIAKGFALDCLHDDLIAGGVTAFLLELGGEVRAAGAHPSGRPWRVAIEDPLSPHLAAHAIVAPGSLALATSGHRANGLMGAVEVSHIIDPHTTRPATGFAASVSVLADTGMEADALATALLAMGPDGPNFARLNDIPALFILGSGYPDASISTGQFSDHIFA